MYIRSYQPLLCQAHALDLRPLLGHGNSQCLSIKCRLASSGCLLNGACIMGLVMHPLIVCQQISRSGLSADRRGSLRTIFEVAASPGYSRHTVNAFLPWSLSVLDENALVKATSSSLRPVLNEQLVVSVHPTLATVGTTLRVLFPHSAKSPVSQVIIDACK